MIPAGGRLGHDIRNATFPEDLGAARMNPPKRSGWNQHGRVAHFFGKFINIDAVFQPSIPFNGHRIDG
jgi:hypothetical protein